MKNAYCAIDLGATSGRIVISSDGLELEEIYRFPNSIYEQEGRYFWDTDRLMSEIMTGLRRLTSREDIHVCSIGVDTWGVDAQVEIGWLMSAASPGYHTTRAVIPEWRMTLYADVGLWNTQAIKIPNNYSVGLRFSVWLNIPRSYPCRCVIDNL